MGNHCLNQDLQNKRMNRIKGDALNRRVRKFGAGYFALKKSKTVTACVGWVWMGGLGRGILSIFHH